MMDEKKILEEKLLEVCSLGDHDHAVSLVQQSGVSVNAQHTINAWTPLHWAAKRGHTSIVSFLLASGADKDMYNDKGQTPIELTTNKAIRELLGGDPNGDVKEETLPIEANYLRHPIFPYASPMEERPSPKQPSSLSTKQPSSLNNTVINSTKNDSNNHIKDDTPVCKQNSVEGDDELVLKARIAHVSETDFIEVEVPFSQLSYYHLVKTLCHELQIEASLVQKVRKLPNTILRKDKDVRRLQQFQEIEVVLTNRALSQASRNYGPQPKHIDVVY